MGALQPILDTLGDTVLIWFGIFTRVAAACFLLPSIGEHAIPARVKLAAALALSAIIVPMVAIDIAPIQPNAMAILHMVGAEILAGLFIGVSIRLLIFALQTAGTIAAQNLSIAQMFGGAMGPEPEPVISNFLTLAAIAAALAAGLHIKIVMALAASYDVVPFGIKMPSMDFGYWVSMRGTALFDLAIGLALPFVIVGFVYNVSLGAINRAMPQMMVSFVGAPAITGMGIGLLMLTAPVILMVWLDHLDAALLAPFSASP